MPSYRKGQIQDDRLVKQPLTPFIYFFKERYSTGDFKNMPINEAAKLVSQEWKALGSSDKQVRPFLPLVTAYSCFRCFSSSIRIEADHSLRRFFRNTLRLPRRISNATPASTRVRTAKRRLSSLRQLRKPALRCLSSSSRSVTSTRRHFISRHEMSRPRRSDTQGPMPL